jgi:hypothetical protein
MPFWAITVLGTAEALLMEVCQRCVRRRDDRTQVVSLNVRFRGDSVAKVLLRRSMTRDSVDER